MFTKQAIHSIQAGDVPCVVFRGSLLLSGAGVLGSEDCGRPGEKKEAQEGKEVSQASGSGEPTH